MSSKNISVREDVYRALKETKGDDESFSDVIERLLRSQEGDHSLFELVGMLDEEELDKLRSGSAEFRESADEQMDRYS